MAKTKDKEIDFEDLYYQPCSCEDRVDLEWKFDETELEFTAECSCGKTFFLKPLKASVTSMVTDNEEEEDIEELEEENDYE